MLKYKVLHYVKSAAKVRKIKALNTGAIGELQRAPLV